ncbi:MAG: dTDP-4-dehydrorhamnose reductase [Roseibium sp.]
MAGDAKAIQPVAAGDKVLVLGASGMAGKAIVDMGKSLGYDIVGASRKGPDIEVDVEDEADLVGKIREIEPRLIINTVADVSVARCEADPGRSWRVNARPAAFLAELSKELRCKFLHVSTDHYFSGDGRCKHAEDHPVTLLNEYARTKFAAEALALSAPGAVVIRTNIVGFRPEIGGTFAEWCLDVIRNDKEATLFDDQFVSSIDIWNFADCVWKLAVSGFSGVINVASRDVFSKAEFALRLAKAEGRTLTRAKIGSVGQQGTRRPDSLGLDTSLAESVTGREMPSLDEVVQAIHRYPAGQDF